MYDFAQLLVFLQVPPYRCDLSSGRFTVDGNEYFLTYGDVQIIKTILQQQVQVGYNSDVGVLQRIVTVFFDMIVLRQCCDLL